MWYALPADDLAHPIAVTASDEDPGYPAELLVEANPAHPAKLTTTSGHWVVQLDAPVNLVGAALIYPLLDAGLDVRIEGNTSDSWGSPPFSESFSIPGPHPDGAAVSTLLRFADGESPDYAFWRLHIVGTNSTPVGIGRLMLLAAIRTFEDGTSVRWGVVEEEDHGIVEMATELGVETVYDLGGKRRELSGEMLLRQEGATQFQELVRSTKGRVFPWLLQPFENVNDVYLVRFSERLSYRRLDVPDPDPAGGYVQVVRMQVTEVSRGLPWP